MWYWGGGIHWRGWFIGVVLTIAFWVVMFYLVLSLMRGIGTHDRSHSQMHEDPERTLARRFANGEINDAEFHRRLDVLRAHDRSGST